MLIYMGEEVDVLTKDLTNKKLRCQCGWGQEGGKDVQREKKDKAICTPFEQGM